MAGVVPAIGFLGNAQLSFVMPGPCAGHPRLTLHGRKDVDGRDKPGHDVTGAAD